MTLQDVEGTALLLLSGMEHMRREYITTFKALKKGRLVLNTTPNTPYCYKVYMNQFSSSYIFLARIHLHFGVWFPSQSLCLMLPPNLRVGDGDALLQTQYWGG